MHVKLGDSGEENGMHQTLKPPYPRVSQTPEASAFQAQKKRLFLRYVENPIAGQVTLESRMAMPSTPGPPAGSGS